MSDKRRIYETSAEPAQRRVLHGADIRAYLYRYQNTEEIQYEIGTSEAYEEWVREIRDKGMSYETGTPP